MARSKCASAAAVMRASQAVLVLVLLLGTVAAAQGRPVSCVNECPKAILVNGVTVAAHAKATVEVANLVNIEVEDAAKVRLFGSFSCPADVTELLMVYEDGCVKVKVGAVAIISKLLHTVLGLVMCLIKCVL